jgi:phenylacetate-CoA ligase
MVINKLRAKAFWALDTFKGKKIKNHYDQISTINNNENSIETKSLREKTIHNILENATTTTPFYKKYSQFKSITDFPVIKKTIVQGNFEDFRSSEYLDKPFHKVATSGSTGVPFFLYHDANKRLRNTADTLYFLEQANYNFGEKLYDIEVWRGINMNNPVKSWMKNLVYVDTSKFNDTEIEAFLDKLKKDTSPKNLIGFASAYESICMYLDKNNSDILDKLKVNAIISISEYLNDYVKSSMKKYFNTSVVSRYSNEELGIIAQQSPNSNEEEFYLNWASYHVEILKMDSDFPADEGEMGRIVITDLFNYSMPLIRYDTGDISMFTEIPTLKNPYPTLKRIEGRKMDVIYNTSGEVISSHLVYTKFYDYYKLLKQYQFIQETATEYTVKLNTHSGKFEFEKELIKSIQDDFGKDAKINLILVDEIPPLSSGKRRKVVNNYTEK